LVTLLVVSTVGWLYFLRPDDTQLDIALTYVVRLLADTLTKSDPRILNQELSLLSPCDPPSRLMMMLRFGAIVCLLHCERQQRKAGPSVPSLAAGHPPIW
jgi:hypothetical protein